MYDLPEPKPTAPAAGQATRDTVIDQAADQMLAALNDAIAREKHQTSYNDPDLPGHRDGPQIGDTPPVPQPDSRIVPPWALGLAVGSIGVGAGVTGLGCGIWLACKGLSSVIHSLSTVTLAGVLTVAIPFAGAAMLATAIGGAISKARQAPTTTNNHFNGTVRIHQDQRTDRTRNVGVWVRDQRQQ